MAARELGGKLARKASTPTQQAPALRRREEPVVRPQQDTPPATLARGDGGGRGGSVSLSRSAPASTSPDNDEKQKRLDEATKGWIAQNEKDKAESRRQQIGWIDDFFAGLGRMGEGQSASSYADKVAQGSRGPSITLGTDGKLDPGQQTPLQVAEENSPQPKTPDPRDVAQSQYQNNRSIKVRELSTDEWNALSPQKQQAVLANFALYQAAEADKKAAASADEADKSYLDTVSTIFGDKGGSDTYAPNTIRLLTELGYQDKTGDLDNFLNGQAVASISTIQNDQGLTDRQGAGGVVDRLASSDVFKSPDLTASLESGAKLLDALRTTKSLSNEFMAYAGTGPNLAGLSDLQLSDLNTTLNNMSNRGVWDLIQADPEANTSLRSDLDKLVQELGQDTVTSYFANQMSGFGGDDTYMSFDEFTKNWLGR